MTKEEINKRRMELEKELEFLNKLSEENSMEKQIEELQECMEIDRIVKTMKFLDWKWINKEVTADMIRERIKYLAELAWKEFEKDDSVPFSASTGGLTVTAKYGERGSECITLECYFALTEWDTNL